MSFWVQLWADVKASKWQELGSTLTQLASVYYAAKNNVLVYPTGIIGVLLAAWVYFFIASPPLYADGMLNMYYFVMSVYGWYYWTQKKDNEADLHPIAHLNTKEWQIGLIGGSLLWAFIYIILIQFTNSNTPVLDSLVTSSAFVAMWWMAIRKIEHWHAWIFSNIVAIPLNIYKGFVLFAVMYIILLGMAVNGYIQWKKMMQE